MIVVQVLYQIVCLLCLQIYDMECLFAWEFSLQKVQITTYIIKNGMSFSSDFYIRFYYISISIRPLRNE